MKVGIVTKSGIEELQVGKGFKVVVSVPKLQKDKKEIFKELRRERMSIAHAYFKQGLEVFLAHNEAGMNNTYEENKAILWINDAYVQNNGLFIPCIEFGELAHGGYYVFGRDFVLVSEKIKDDLEKLLHDNRCFQVFFKGKDIIYTEPFQYPVPNGKGDMSYLRHIDLMMGSYIASVPGNDFISVDEKLYQQQDTRFEDLKKRYNIHLVRTTVDGDNLDHYGKYFEWFERKRLNAREYDPWDVPPKEILGSVKVHRFPNNFFAVYTAKGPVIVMERIEEAGKQFDKRANVHYIEIPLDYLRDLGGSVKCTSNTIPDERVLQVLGIPYRKFESITEFRSPRLRKVV